MNAFAVFNGTAWRTHFKNPCADAVKSPAAVSRTLFQQAGAPFNVTVPTSGHHVAAIVSCHSDEDITLRYRVTFLNPGAEHLPRDVCCLFAFKQTLHPTNHTLLGGA